MSEMHNKDHEISEDYTEEELEKQILQELHLSSNTRSTANIHEQATIPANIHENTSSMNGDVQGALGLFAEASQDMATAGVELGLGRHFACVDFCNQAVEKAAQAISLLRYGRRSMYDHDLRALGAQVDAPLEVQDEMARLTPFHPEAFYADTPPEEADEIINAEQAADYVQSARQVLRWARNIVLNA